MGRLVLTENITLDGVVEASDWFDVSSERSAEMPDLLDVTRQQMAAEAALLLGRVTFEEFRGYWPAQVDDTTGITRHLDEVPKYVVSSTLTDPGWGNTTVLAGDPASTVAELKARVDGDIGCTGSITLARTLLAEGLVDELRLIVYPSVLGTGRRLLEHPTRDLRLRDVRHVRGDIATLTYALG